MELRSSYRSRSNTPIIRTFSNTEIIDGGNHIEQTFVRSTRSTTKKEFISDGNNVTNISHFVDEETTNLPKIKDGKSNKAVVRRSRYKTSDYSSEESDQLVSSSYTHDQNSTNEFIEEARRSISRNSGNVSALDFYRASGDYWNKVPKTDYTYSRHSRDRKEIAPGVVAMPNMSRKSLHDYNFSSDRISMDKQTFTDELDEYDYAETSKFLSKHNLVRPRNLFTNSVSTAKLIKRKSVFNVFTSIFVTIFAWISSIFYYLYRVHNSAIIWFGKKIHKGTTRLMLFDTWLLRSFQNRSKLKSLLVLCLMPLLFLAGWWLLSGLGPLLYGAYFNSSSSPPVPEKVVVKNDEIISMESLKSTPDTEDIVAKIIQNPAIQDIIQKYNRLTVKSDYNSKEELLERQQVLIDNLREEINKIRFEIIELEKNRAEEIARITAQLRSENAEKNARLTYQLDRCCSRSFVHIEKYVAKILKDLLGVPQHISSHEDISKWISSAFVARRELEKRLQDLTGDLQSDYNLLIENNEKIIMDKVAAKISAELGERVDYMMQNRRGAADDVTLGSLTDEHIKKIVFDSLAIYDADRTGLVDYALETAGGQILSTRCTESYQARTAVVSIFGIPLWYPTNTPRTAITAGLVPGECWAFQNFPGFLLIKLAAPVKIDMFSLEHISKLLVPNGKIDSAPKEFSIYGLRNETDRDPVLLGEYVYNCEGPPLQYFAAAIRGLTFNIVELRIHSNHGNPNYTCLYRFRVHGSLTSEIS